MPFRLLPALRSASAAPVLLVVVHDAGAALTFHDPADIVVSADFAGVYLDFDDFSDPSSYSTGTTPPGPGGAWDLNIFFGGIAIGNSDTLQPVTATVPAVNAPVLNLSLGDTVGPSPTVGAFPADTSGSTSDHLGPGSNQFLEGQSGYIGFRLQPDSFSPASSGVHYGFMSVILGADGSTGVIEWWAWETTPDTPVAVTQIPEPGVIALFTLGLLGWAGHRRRRLEDTVS